MVNLSPFFGFYTALVVSFSFMYHERVDMDRILPSFLFMEFERHISRDYSFTNQLRSRPKSSFSPFLVHTTPIPLEDRPVEDLTMDEMRELIRRERVSWHSGH